LYTTLKKLLYKIKLSSFIKAFILLVSGSALAQLINFALQPVLTRLYSPEEFGLYAIFLSGVGLLGSLTTLRLDLSIISAEDDSDAKGLFYVCLVITTLVSALIFMLIVTFKSLIIDFFNMSNHTGWLYVLPIALLLNGLYSTITNFNYRYKYYKDISKSTIMRVAALIGFQIVFFYFGMGYLGLVLGYAISLLFGLSSLYFNIVKYIKPINEVNIQMMFKILNKYKDYPIYQLPTSFVNHFTYESIIFGIGSMYSKSSLGLYSLTHRILSLPLSVISESTRQLFIKQVMENKNEPLKVRKNFIYLGCFLLIGISIPFTLLAIYGNQIFGFFFGQEWELAGDFVQVLITLYIVRFVVYPLSGVVLVYKKQKLSLIYHSILIFCVLIAVILGYILGLNVTQYLLIQSILMSIIYILYGISCYRVVLKAAKIEANSI
jgi:O-antigen/teichoic acid export membrane protein